MSVEVQPRFQIYTWSADTDSFTREQMEQSHSQIELLGSVIRQGTLAEQQALPAGLNPANTIDYSRTFFYDTTNRVIYYSDGTNWRALNQFGTAGQMAAIEIQTTSSSAGSSTNYARIDHRHAGPGFGSPVSTGSTNAAGSLNTAARSDHVHAIGSGTVTPPALASSVAGNGLVLDSGTGLAVNVDNSTLEISADSLRLKGGGASAGVNNSHTTTTYRTIRVSSVEPSGNIGKGDLWINNGSASGDFQLRQYIDDTSRWASQVLVQKTPAIKASWNIEFPVTSTNYYYAYEWLQVQFPASDAERAYWYSVPYSEITKGFNLLGKGAVKIPYDGYYFLHGSAAWRTTTGTAWGNRELYIQRARVGTTDYQILDGGSHIPDLNPYGGTEYTRANAQCFTFCKTGDLIQLVGRAYGPAPAPSVSWSGGNLSIAYISAI